MNEQMRKIIRAADSYDGNASKIVADTIENLISQMTKYQDSETEPVQAYVSFSDLLTKLTKIKVRLDIGLWSSEVGSFPKSITSKHEICLVTKGRVKLLDDASCIESEHSKGDIFFIPARSTVEWTVMEPLEKIYILWDDEIYGPSKL
eukprot:g3201.t1